MSELKSDVKTQTIRETVQIDIKNSGPSKQEVIVEDCLWRWHTYSISPCQPRCADSRHLAAHNKEKETLTVSCYN